MARTVLSRAGRPGRLGGGASRGDESCTDAAHRSYDRTRGAIHFCTPFAVVDRDSLVAAGERRSGIPANRQTLEAPLRIPMIPPTRSSRAAGETTGFLRYPG